MSGIKFVYLTISIFMEIVKILSYYCHGNVFLYSSLLKYNLQGDGSLLKQNRCLLLHYKAFLGLWLLSYHSFYPIPPLKTPVTAGDASDVRNFILELNSIYPVSSNINSIKYTIKGIKAMVKHIDFKKWVLTIPGSVNAKSGVYITTKEQKADVSPNRIQILQVKIK
ncbi:hypothetical protein BDF21DRAFT_401849 [Thamnidium elegans]|nr:hypothetical protein BDF21DRAFT_401849 [Thamnidium elegans]